MTIGLIKNISKKIVYVTMPHYQTFRTDRFTNRSTELTPKSVLNLAGIDVSEISAAVSETSLIYLQVK